MRRRQAFTLVELLVALALIIFVMTVLSEAFVAAAKVFRDFKAIGDMNGRLRTATQLLRRDLGADHFEAKKRLSDSSFWTNGPPSQGFFRIWQQSTPTNEGADLDGINSYTATGTWLHFSVKQRGNQPENFFLADLSKAATSPLLNPTSGTLGSVPVDGQYQDPTGTIYKSQWAEVAWFLRTNGATANGTPLYALYRRQLLAVPDNTLNWSAPGPVAGANTTGYEEVSCKTNGTNLYFNSLNDLTVPQRRFGMAAQAPAGVYSQTLPTAALATTDVSYGGIPVATDGTYPIWVTSTANTYDQVYGTGLPFSKQAADVVATDVISFDVRVLRPTDADFVDLSQLGAMNNPAFSSVKINGVNQAVTVFDTWSSANDGTYDYSGWATAGTTTSVPLQAQILAIKVSIRIWDFKTEQARQVSLVVDM